LPAASGAGFVRRTPTFGSLDYCRGVVRGAMGWNLE
jgi:hypothetical protein